MARKNVLNYKVAVDQSLTANFTSNPTVIKWLDNASYQLVVTTTDSVGTFAIQGSNNYAISEPGTLVVDPGNWDDIPLEAAPGSATAPSVSAANDTILIDLNQLPFSAVRVIYTSTTPGTGTVTIILNAKQLGG